MPPKKSVAGHLQLALRAAVASAFAVSAAKYFNLADPIYALIAAVVVTDLSPQETRRLSFQRIAGTLIGAGIGGLFDVAFPNNIFMMGCAILVAMSVCDLIRLENGVKVAAYVAGIVVLFKGGAVWMYALNRTLETCLGIFFAILVSFVPAFSS